MTVPDPDPDHDHDVDHGAEASAPDDDLDLGSHANVYDLNDPARRSDGFAEAKLALARSGLVVLPTDTVYGLAADAFDPIGVRRLLRAKGRGRDMPTPVLIGSADTLRALATNLTEDIRALADRFWPGGLTLICRQQPSLRWDLGDSRATVALRMPDQQDTIDLLSDNGPLAVSSANLTGRPAATTVEEARDMLGDAVDVYLDGGPTPGNVPSTIVDCTGEVPRVVRVGAVSVAALREVVTGLEAPDEPDDTGDTGDTGDADDTGVTIVPDEDEDEEAEDEEAEEIGATDVTPERPADAPEDSDQGPRPA